MYSNMTPSTVALQHQRRKEGASRQAVDVACQYVIVADGVGSPIRKMIGFAMEMQELINVHFFSKDPGQLLLGNSQTLKSLHFSGRNYLYSTLSGSVLIVYI